MNKVFPALRGLAIVLVVLNHTTHMGTLYPANWGYPAATGWEHLLILALNTLGVLAVPTFMFLSGGFFAYAAQSAKANISFKTVWSGLNHLIWPYVIWSWVFYGLVYFFHNQTYSLLGYLKNLIVGYPFDFVPLLLFYYLLSPLLVHLFKRFGWIPIVLIAVYQLFLINLRNPGALGFTFPVWAHYLRMPVLSSTLADWAVYFPLGLIFSLQAKRLMPQLQKICWVLLALTGVFFSLTVLDAATVISFPMAAHICPLAFIAFSPTLKRDAIPLVRHFEMIGKKSYGLYLTHLIVLDLTLLALHSAAPWLLGQPLLLMLLLFSVALGIPLALMNSVERIPTRGAYRYVFG